MDDTTKNSFDFNLLICYLSIFMSLLTGAMVDGHFIHLGFELVITLLILSIVLCCIFLTICVGNSSGRSSTRYPPWHGSSFRYSLRLHFSDACGTPPMDAGVGLVLPDLVILYTDPPEGGGEI